MKKLVLFIFLISGFSGLAQNPYPIVKIGEGPAISGPNEPSIGISKKDPGTLVVGANINRVYHSSDSGRTWTEDRLESKYGVWGDPCILPSPDGRFYFFHLSDPTGLNWQSDELLDRIVCQRSNKKGTRWNKGTYMGLNPPKDQDKEWACMDPDTEEIGVSWTQFDVYDSKDPKDESNILFSKSKRKGRKWSDPIQINELPGNCLDDDQTVEGAVPTVGVNGEWMVAWAYDERLFFDYSLDGGKTWQEKDILVATQPGGWSQEIPGLYRVNGLPVLAVDRSGGAHHGTLYLNWTDQRHGEDNTDVFISKSTDGGRSWSEPILVNQDETVSHQFLSWMTVDQSTGTVYCVYYDRSGHDEWETTVTLASSNDGGETWLNEAITTQPFKPLPVVFFGDYNNIAANNGMVRPVWTELHGKKLSIYTALINKKAAQ